MSAAPAHDATQPILRFAWEAMPQAMRNTVISAPVIPQIAARAKAAAAKHPGFVRGDQGQVVDVMPDREVYYGPSSGLPELRRLVARFWTLAYDLCGRDGLPVNGLEADHVAIVSGATEGIAILMRLLAPGRVIGVQRFCWGNYRNIIAHAGGEAKTLDFFAPDGTLDLKGLSAAIEESNIRTLLVNFPANPTGDVLSDDELASLAKLARERDLVLVSDEVYNWIRYEGTPRTLLEFAPERTLVVGAASKEYLIPGARTGYILSADTTFCGEWMPRLIRSTSSSPNVLGQRLATEMLEADVTDLETGRAPRVLSTIREELRTRRDAIVEVLQSAGFKIESRHAGLPMGGIALLARLPEGIEDDGAVIDTAIDLGRFSAIPGSAFGAPRCIRFGYAGIPVDGIERLAAGLPEVLDAMR
ncbi:MAG: pyridoxal phosphate-dependent aminotransferase [Acidobacteria bacterium]|jgi:aspartate/methionine/tyrosine aminotransferase|nr:pyridoxal phosphate-dependent aminotransferase [Acidobacteriota bacterium]